MKRAHISLTTKLAAALLKLGDIPYAQAKLMTAKDFVSLYQFDHNILHGIEVNDAYWNLTPMLITPHREKSKRDTGIVAKARRIDEKWKDFVHKLHSGQKPVRRKSKWPSRPMARRVKK